MVDNLITLYEANARDFSTNGLGSLNKAVSCEVTEKRNAEYELELVYPIEIEDISSNEDLILMDGSRDAISDYSGSNISIISKPVIYDEIRFNRIIVAKPNPYATPQPFRIYSISKPINGLITVNAQHISYDLSGVSVSPFSATSLADAFVKIKSKAVGFCPFTFWTDKVSVGNIGTAVPMSMRSILGGTEGSILDRFGGEYEFDKFTVKLHNNRGTNNGVSIRYGKNLTDITQDENCSGVYTEVYPYWYSETEEGSELVELPEKTVKVEGTFDHTKVLAVDLTEYFESKPTKDELRYVAQMYINAYNIGVPDISLTVSFAPLSQTTEYKDYALLERVNLCDTVNIEFPKLNISATAKCIATHYDVLANKYISIELGNARSDLSASFESVAETIKELPTKSFLEKAIENATNLITGQDGGYVVLNPPTQPRELLIMDQPTIEEATKVWRWNAGGLGYSSNGYNGPYKLAITMDGSIVADFINTGTLNANLIKAGLLTDFNNTNYWDLSAGKALFTNLKVRQNLSLVDGNNFRRIGVGYDADYGSGMWFYNGTDTSSLVYIGVPYADNPNRKYPQIALGDRYGNTLTQLSGSDNGGTLTISNPQGIPTVQLFNGTIGGNIWISDHYGIPAITFSTLSKGGAFAVKDFYGDDVISAFNIDNGGHFAVRNSDGQQVAYLSVDENGKGIINSTGGIWGDYMGKKWVRTYVYFDTIPVNRTWGSIFCSVEQKVNYTALGITNIDNVYISLVTMSGGMWAWPVNTKQDDTYVYFVLARPTRESCNEVKVSLLIVGE